MQRHCHFQQKQLAGLEKYIFSMLEELKKDGLVEFNNEECRITEMGHYFIRNICSAFDYYLQKNKAVIGKNIFSKAI